MERRRAIIWVSIIALPVAVGLLGRAERVPRASRPEAVRHHLPESQPVGRNWDVVPAFPQLSFTNALALRQSPTANGEWYLIERTGRVLAFQNDPECRRTRVIVDLTTRLGAPLDVEQGVLGLAFHPKFGDLGSPHRGELFLFYAGREGGRNFNRLSRFKTFSDPLATLASEVVLIDQTDPHHWHNGGCIEFGPDGFLYIAVGDGGGLNDQFQNSQRIDGGLFSGILRIDVDRRGGDISHPPPRQPLNGRTAGYFIPGDNPFVGSPNGLEEFWSIGLRNPFRISFDADTGDLWVGEVGSLGAEEINIATRGSNHQWSYREGHETFPHSTLTGEPPTEIIGTETPPLYAYPQHAGTHCIQEGNCVIGGTVYRGDRHPKLHGQYLFGDYGTGRIWAMPARRDDQATPTQLLQFPSSGEQRLASFAVDRGGEILLVVGPNAGASSTILRLCSREDTETLPAHLSGTGLFTSLKPLIPNPTLIPYEVNSPLWSSGTIKRRWIGLPAAAKIDIQDDGSWVFPVGTVLVKHFDAPPQQSGDDPRKIETRVLVCDNRGGINGATYRWRDDESEADLVDWDGAELQFPLPNPTGLIEPQTYRLPSRIECLHCHNAHAGFVLGVNPRQLNRDLPGELGNQLANWDQLGLFSRRLTASELSRHKALSPIDSPVVSLDKRVRSYLDANCSHCHRPGANIRAWFDLREQTALSETGLINGIVADSFDITGARVVVPGDTGRSILYQRIASPDLHYRMPPLAISTVDHMALGEIRAWIERMPPVSPGH